MTMITRDYHQHLTPLHQNSKWVWSEGCGYMCICRRRHNMEELHEVAKEFDSHHLGGGGGTGTTGIRTRVHSQPAINVNILK